MENGGTREREVKGKPVCVEEVCNLAGVVGKGWTMGTTLARCYPTNFRNLFLYLKKCSFVI